MYIARKLTSNKSNNWKQVEEIDGVDKEQQ